MGDSSWGSPLHARTSPARPPSLVGHSRHLRARSSSLRGPRGDAAEDDGLLRRTDRCFLLTHFHGKSFTSGGRDGRAEQSHSTNTFASYSFTAHWGAEPGNGHYNTMSPLFFVRYPDVASVRTCLFVHNSSLCVSCFIGPTLISSVQVI